ncbi:MAG: DNA-binding protein Alba [Promethearchaeota archaeon]
MSKPRKNVKKKKDTKDRRPSTPLTKEHAILIGTKPVAAYVMACVTQFNQGAEVLVLKARGRAISRAVDVAEVLRRRFMKDLLEVTNIQIDTEQIERTEGTLSNVSAIEITLTRI